MRWQTIALALPLLCACGSSTPETPAAVDVVGTWTADFMVNISAASPGDDVAHFGDVTFAASTYQSSSDENVGTAELISVVYASQGSLQDPTLDPEGNPLAEAVGTVTYRGTWHSTAYEGNPDFTIDVTCEEVKLTANRPDLQATCGAQGFDTSVYADCTRPEGATTFHCAFGAGDITFHRQ